LTGYLQTRRSPYTDIHKKKVPEFGVIDVVRLTKATETMEVVFGVGWLARRHRQIEIIFLR
jgi:hypothetical protein